MDHTPCGRWREAQFTPHPFPSLTPYAGAPVTPGSGPLPRQGSSGATPAGLGGAASDAGSALALAMPGSVAGSGSRGWDLRTPGPPGRVASPSPGKPSPLWPELAKRVAAASPAQRSVRTVPRAPLSTDVPELPRAARPASGASAWAGVPDGAAPSPEQLPPPRVVTPVLPTGPRPLVTPPVLDGSIRTIGISNLPGLMRTILPQERGPPLAAVAAPLALPVRLDVEPALAAVEPAPAPAPPARAPPRGAHVGAAARQRQR